MLRLDRTRRAGPLLVWKVRIFAAGAVLALAGLYFGERWMTGVAIGVLAVGVGLRWKGAASEDESDA